MDARLSFEWTTPSPSSSSPSLSRYTFVQFDSREADASTFRCQCSARPACAGRRRSSVAIGAQPRKATNPDSCRVRFRAAAAGAFGQQRIGFLFGDFAPLVDGAMRYRALYPVAAVVHAG